MTRVATEEVGRERCQHNFDLWFMGNGSGDGLVLFLVGK